MSAIRFGDQTDLLFLAFVLTVSVSEEVRMFAEKAERRPSDLLQSATASSPRTSHSADLPSPRPILASLLVGLLASGTPPRSLILTLR